MTMIIIQRFIAAGFLLFLISSCSADNPIEGSSGVYFVRVVNERPDSIAVIIGPADYGTIAPNDTTVYMKVDDGDNTIWLNGNVFEGSPAKFGTGIPNTCRWTFVFDASWHFSLDYCN